MNKLYRSRSDRVLAGICGGLGSYFEIDSTIIRLVFSFLWIITGIFPLTIGYLLGILIIPLELIDQKTTYHRFFYRSQQNKMFAGICGAIAESWDIDPTIIRFVAVILALLTGIVPGILIYCFGWILIPQKTIG